ncbi:hypothetical protein HYR82_01175 [Candidatus Peregrinibacteria bacterium]|nr:hypothetical protein [Candidatus Peregrinibacteria bacterium]
MTNAQNQDPATKQDLADLEERLEKKITTAIQKSKRQLKKELVHEFKVINEKLVHDFNGAHKDKIGVLEDNVEDHGQRITHLEVVTGLARASR